MSKKNLEVVELNKKEEQIILEEKQKPIVSFWRLHRFQILSILLILSLLTCITGVFIFLSNIYQSEEPTIEKASVDTTLSDYNKYVDGGRAPITEETAKNRFLNTGDFKTSGEVITIKTIETGSFIIKFYSDGTALKINKKSNIITRINPLENGEYGINSKGETNRKVTTRDVTVVNTKEYPWGTVSYFSDGSAEITNSKMNIFVRDSNDINDNYISNNKVSYLKEIKTVGSNTLNYYYDGTIEVVKNGKSYLVRNERDLNISSSDITFPNDNSANIYKTITTDDGYIIDYYQDGGAIIKKGTRTISVRKSNSIIIKNNKIYEIVDNMYVEVSNTRDKDNVIYYTNGGTVYNYQGKTYYNEENSNLLFNNGILSSIATPSEDLTKHTDIEDEDVQIFEKNAVIKTKDYTAIVPKEGILYDKNGKIKDITSDDSSTSKNDFKIINNSSKKVKYRIVIEKSPRTDLDVTYLRYQLQVKEKYYPAKKLDNDIWYQDNLSNSLGINGTNYILLDDIIEPYDTINVRLMLWTDYETTPNSMQDKYFYGTIKVYAWIEK